MMVKLIERCFRFFGNSIYLGSKFFWKMAELLKKTYAPVSDKNKVHWYKDPRNQEKLYEFELDEESIVFDVGAYQGDWSSKVFSRYACRVYGFEPVESFYNDLCKRFKRNKKIKMYPFGLGGRSLTQDIFIAAESSSIISADQGKSSSSESIEVKSFTEFCQSEDIDQIDVVKMNIEGAEFDLLDHLLSHKAHENIRYILIQFHDFVPQSDIRRQKIREQLQLTHKEQFCLDFVWELWERK